VYPAVRWLLIIEISNLSEEQMTTINRMSVKLKVLEILAEDPDIPYSNIGDEVGVSRERVRQIARQCGYPPRSCKGKPGKTCPACGKIFYKKNNTYCSTECGYKSRRRKIVLNCHQCGKSIERTPGTMRSRSGYYFCDRACFGRWTGKNHSSISKARKHLKGDFGHEIGSREEFPVKGRTLSPEVMKIYNLLLQLNENELIKVRNNKKDKLRRLGTAIKRKASKQGINVTSAIRDVNGNSLLFLMRVGEDG
jgi:MYM-type Zinc finger with FCS sequence motif